MFRTLRWNVTTVGFGGERSPSIWKRRLKMKVKLTMNIPVNSIHGMVKGRELDVLEDEDGDPRWGRSRRRLTYAWVMGHDEEEVKLLQHEFEVIDE